MDEDLIENYFINIFRKIWLGRKLVFKFCISSVLIGLIVIIISPKVYISETTFVPQTSDQNSSASKELGSLASLAGINLTAESLSSIDNYLSPLLYSKIIESEEFTLSLSDQEIVNENGTKVLLKDYVFNKKTRFSLIGYLSKLTSYLFKKNNNEGIILDEILTEYKFISNEDLFLINFLNSKFDIEINKIDGFIKVFAYDENPIISTQLVDIITKTLQSKIIELRTKKIKEQLIFSELQYLKQKKLFENLQNELAEFKDSNKNISTAVFRSRLQMLESEYQLQQGILIRLSSEYHNNKIKLNKDTPIFSVLDEVSVPNTHTKPFSLLIIFASSFIGLISSISYLLIKDYIKDFYKKILK